MSIHDEALECVTAVELDTPSASISMRTEASIARIDILLGPSEGNSHNIGNDCIIGRASDAAIQLHDPGVSRKHARIYRQPSGSFVLEDLGSRNGTLLNGQRIASTPLESGNQIQLGPRCLLLFSLVDHLEETLAQAKKMEIIGRLSASINHDFNNLLCVVLANAAHLLELPRDLPLGDTEIRECLQDIRSAADTGAELTSRLGTLIQGGSAAFEAVDFSEFCVATLEGLRTLIPENIRIDSHIESGIKLRGVRSHLRYLVVNPCLNSRDAMSSGGNLTVEMVIKARHELAKEPLVKSSRYVVLSIADTGCGMDSQVLASAFEAFFTSREIEVGSGLGLTIVRKVAADLGGFVEIQSERNVGTTVRIILPVIELDPQLDGPQDPQSESLLSLTPEAQC